MSTPENHKRAENLRSVVRQEIEDFQGGTIERLSTIPELSTRFGYKSPKHPRRILARAKLLEERKLTQTERKYKLESSNELAWILGVLSGGGHAKKYEIELESNNKELLTAFKSRGERVFKVNARLDLGRPHSVFGKVVETPAVSFFNREASNAVGDLRKNYWQNTVLTMHRWILENEKYVWSFLEGFFEVRGSEYGINSETKGRGYSLQLSTSCIESANFLLELLVRVGLDNPKRGVRGVFVRNLKDIKKFANNVHPVTSDKEVKLALYRDRAAQIGRMGGKPFLYPDEQVIEEWTKAHDLLDHPPTTYDIEKLRREGVLMCSRKIFIRRFGAGSFRKARENLEGIVAEQRGRLRITTD